MYKKAQTYTLDVELWFLMKMQNGGLDSSVAGVAAQITTQVRMLKEYSEKVVDVVGNGSYRQRKH